MARTREQRHPSLPALIDALLPFTVPAPSPNPGAMPSARQPLPRPPEEGALPTRSSARSDRSSPELRGARTRWTLAASALLIAAGAGSWLWSARPSTSQLKSAPPASKAAASTPAAPSPLPATARAAARAAARTADDTPNADRTRVPELGADATPPARSTKPSKFTSGWVYLGDHANGTWNRRYFDGWSGDLPAPGTKLNARGRSYVRAGLPDLTGALAEIRTTLGPEHGVELLELSRWQGGRYVWARVRPAW